MIKKILDRLLLFSIGTLFLSMQDISAQSVAVWLIALSLTALGLYFDEKPVSNTQMTQPTTTLG